MATSKRFDVVTPRPKYGKEGETWWHRVGNATQNERGMITIYLDSVPVPDPTRENKIVMMLFEPRERDDKGSSGSKPEARAQRPRPSSRDDDEIPF